MAKSSYSNLAVAGDSAEPAESNFDWESYLLQREDHLLADVGSFIKGAIAPLQRRIEQLESKQLDYAEIYEHGRSYRAGQAVTHDGAIFIATRDYPEAAPGKGAKTGWRLAVKTERPAK